MSYPTPRTSASSLPSVSIVVPVYNGGIAFRRCLTSLQKWATPYQSPQQSPQQPVAAELIGVSTGRNAKATLGNINSDRPSQISTSPVSSSSVSTLQPVALSDNASGHGGPTLAPGAVEVIVVSDGDSDGSWRLAEEFGAQLIRLSESGGPANARNIGAEAARGDILFFVDADVEILPDTVHRVMESFQDDPQLAALIGSYDDAPGAPNFLSQYKNLFHHYTHQTACLEASTFWGACGAIRRPIFKAVGGFDKNYVKPCIEDIELGYRLKEAGYTIHLRKDIQVKHLKKWTTVSLVRADVFYRALPWMALLWQVRQAHPAQYQRFTSDLNLKWNSRISVMLVYVLLLCVLVTPWVEVAIGGALLLGVALLLINLPVYAFFRQKRGWLFALKTVPWHWLYFFYSGLAYVVTFVGHQLRHQPRHA